MDSLTFTFATRFNHRPADIPHRLVCRECHYPSIQPLPLLLLLLSLSLSLSLIIMSTLADNVKVHSRKRPVVVYSNTCNTDLSDRFRTQQKRGGARLGQNWWLAQGSIEAITTKESAPGSLDLCLLCKKNKRDKDSEEANMDQYCVACAATL